MILRVWAAATLAFFVMSAATPGPARAQWGNLSKVMPFRPKSEAQGARVAARYPQDAHEEGPTAIESFQQNFQPQAGGPTSGYYEPQTAQPPQGHVIEGHESHSNEGHIIEGHSMDGGYYTDGGGSVYGGGEYGGYDSACCDTCGSTGSNCSSICPPGMAGMGFGGSPGRFYVSADYLYVRANFSEAVAYLIHDPDLAPEFFDEFHELDFQYESSFRVGGGYFIDCCDEQIRFMFTRLSSFAEDFTDDENAIGPFETSPGPGGTLDIFADVDAKSWDLEYAKTFRLGGQTCGCECADPCGCAQGDTCGCGSGCGVPSCPEWAITWSGGLRFADVDWQRSYFSENPQAAVARDAISTMSFQGGGPRFGLEGRRFFGPSRCASLFLKGDISLLLGDVELLERRTDFGATPTVPDTVLTQTATHRNIIPVTEIESGLSVQMIDGVSFSTGYLFSAWHDLGFRDQFNFATFLETNYDDANILGFDGFFARIEACY